MAGQSDVTITIQQNFIVVEYGSGRVKNYPTDNHHVDYNGDHLTRIRRKEGNGIYPVVMEFRGCSVIIIHEYNEK